LIGRQLGNYQIVELLGQGGMATVYIGYQEAVDRKVAIKVLPPHPGLDDQFIERFQIEARTIARLQHPHILPLYDYGQVDDILYLAMAYIEGGTLEDLIQEGPMPVRRVERVLREVASALDYAHRQGIIHRDIKPGNILLDSEGHALLADFGIAKIAGGANLTGTGVVGTPAYMAPEQAQGSQVDTRADIYALGVVIYQMLTGQQPFTAETPMKVLLKVLQEPVPDIMQVVDGLPEELGEVMQQVMAKEPDMRYQSAVSFAEAFSRAIHRSDESLAAARREVNLERPADDELPTMAKGSRPPATTMPAGKRGENDSQTIIVQQGANPLILLGGFAIIAVAIVAVVILVLGSQGGGDDDNETTPTPGAVAAVTDEVADTPTPTEPPVIAPTPSVETFGRLTFNTVGAMGDSVNMQTSGLRPPGSGLTYVAWLLNTTDGSTVRLGNLAVDPLGSAVLAYTDEEGRMLPAFFNAIIITLETTGAVGDVPAGDTAYSSQVPPDIMTLLTEMFVESEDGLSGGSLLDGALAEARTAAQHAGLAAGSSTLGALQTHAEHTVNILRGTQEDLDGTGGGQNPGRGVGVYFFVDAIEGHVDTALAAPTSNRELEINAEYIRVCLQNTRIRADGVIELEGELLASESVEAVADQAAESQQLAEQLQSGFDLNDDGIVNPFEGECGLEQITTYGILISAMDIVEGPLASGE
jgi:tRNA A-37 threonylcarbamoyl transferase component Bud32